MKMPAYTRDRPRALLAEIDHTLFGLLQEWLAAQEWAVYEEATCDQHTMRPDLVVIDVPFPRHGGLGALRRIQEKYPTTPIIMLSPTFFTSIESEGTVARALGVAAVLPSPVARDVLISAANRFSGSAHAASSP